MYWNTGPVENNLKWVRQNGGPVISDFITGVLPCCNIAHIDTNGTFVIGTDITNVVQGYKAYNLSVHPVASIPDVSTQQGLQTALQGVGAMVAWLSATGSDGVTIDYEPSKNYTTQHVENYAAFLTALNQEAEKAGKQAGPDLAGWGILDKVCC